MLKLILCKDKLVCECAFDDSKHIEIKLIKSLPIPHSCAARIIFFLHQRTTHGDSFERDLNF